MSLGSPKRYPCVSKFCHLLNAVCWIFLLPVSLSAEYVEICRHMAHGYYGYWPDAPSTWIFKQSCLTRSFLFRECIWKLVIIYFAYSQTLMMTSVFTTVCFPGKQVERHCWLQGTLFWVVQWQLKKVYQPCMSFWTQTATLFCIAAGHKQYCSIISNQLGKFSKLPRKACFKIQVQTLFYVHLKYYVTCDLSLYNH